MTEDEWLTCTDPTPMLDFIWHRASDRKLRLFVVACCYHCPKILAHQPYLEAIERAERYADGNASKEQLATVFRNNDDSLPEMDLSIEDLMDRGIFLVAHPCPLPVEAVEVLARNSVAEATSSCTTFNSVAAVRSAEFGWQSQVLGDIFGNPFRPISINPNWLTPTMTNIATATYEERALPYGELDTCRLAILADALEDAGCDNMNLLGHLRSPRPHVRGCFAVDLLLGKE